LIHDGISLRALTASGAIDLAFHADSRIPLPTTAADAPEGKLVIAVEFSLCTSAMICPFTVLRLNQDGSDDSAFTPASTDWEVSNLLLQSDGRILVAGGFGSINGVARAILARLNPNGTLDESFKPDLVEEPFRSAIIALDGENILVSLAGRVAFHPSIQRLRPDGSLDKVFPVRLSGGDNPQPYLQSIVPQGRKLRIQGGFSAVNDFPVRGGIARLLLDEAPKTAVVFAPETSQVLREGMGHAEITVRRLGDVRDPATITYQTQDGSAKAGQDYTAVSGTLSFAPFETEKSLPLPIINDDENEPDETVQLVLSARSGVDFVAPPTTFVIQNDDGIRIERLSPDASGGFDMFFRSIPGGHYILEGSSDLKDWKTVLTSDSRFFFSDGSYSSGFVQIDGGGVTRPNYRFFRIKREL